MRLSLGEPLTFQPIFKERIWGGRRLESVLGKKLPPEKRIGESWEIVDRPEAQSVVSQGPLRGQTMEQLWRNYRREIFGETIADAPRFPLIAKLIDAREDLSLQVHPPAEVAQKLGGEPKNEIWFCLEAERGAELMGGFRRGATRSAFERALAHDAIAELIHRIKVQPGDAFFVPSGRIHAIGAGNLIMEISQNSDTTYRVFDWNRGAREMHVGQALASIDFNDFEPELLPLESEQTWRCPYFGVEKLLLNKPQIGVQGGVCAIIFCLTGAVEIADHVIKPGDFSLVPACADQLELKPAGEKTCVLRITIPSR